MLCDVIEVDSHSIFFLMVYLEEGLIEFGFAFIFAVFSLFSGTCALQFTESY